MDLCRRGKRRKGKGLKGSSHRTAPVVAIDGPAGAGKSTVARSTAKLLNFQYLDTGAMYRIATLISMKENIPPDREDELVKEVKRHRISFSEGESGQRVFLNDSDVSEEIRTPELTAKIGPICELAGIRELMGHLQRQLGENGGVVLEGRDIGTVIFPDAEVKIFLNATHEERAKRRWKEMDEKGINITYKEVLNNIKERDSRDSHRDLAPLIKAGDAIEIDTTGLSLAEVISSVVDEVKKHL